MIPYTEIKFGVVYLIGIGLCVTLTLIWSGAIAALDDYFDEGIIAVYLMLSVIWPLVLLALIFMAIGGLLFGIGYLIGLPFLPKTKEKDSPLDQPD
jgi:hypothetical protein